MRTHPLFLAAALPLLAVGCSRAEAGDAVEHPTPLGAAERTDRIQFLSNASSALIRAEDAFHHGKAVDGPLADAVRLVDLAHRSAESGGEPVEAAWEAKAAQALAELRQGADAKEPAKAEDGIGKAKIYLDQAQQAASIEF